MYVTNITDEYDKITVLIFTNYCTNNEKKMTYLYQHYH